MEVSAFFVGMRLALSLLEVNSVVGLGGSVTGLKQRTGLTKTTVGTESGLVKCNMQGTAHLPVFSMDGDYVIGGVFSIHSNMHLLIHNYTTMPDPLRCTGRLVIEVMNKCCQRCKERRAGNFLLNAAINVLNTVKKVNVNGTSCFLLARKPVDLFVCTYKHSIVFTFLFSHFCYFM